jgi:hypothetical protein
MTKTEEEVYKNGNVRGRNMFQNAHKDKHGQTINSKYIILRMSLYGDIPENLDVITYIG